jgi:hypothetical protein
LVPLIACDQGALDPVIGPDLFINDQFVPSRVRSSAHAPHAVREGVEMTVGDHGLMPTCTPPAVAEGQ